MDFGSSPNLIELDGKSYVGEGQKSGIYHLVDASTMKPAWTSLVGPPSAVGGIVGSTAYADGAIYGPITVGGYLWSVSDSGDYRWFAPVADGAHWGNPVSSANGVVYTVDLKGFLNAYDAATGLQVLGAPMWAAGDGLKASWGGVAIARNTVYAAVGTLGTNGALVAYRTP
jgi:polyvinyl alcohol dehydrogenase (cytochrome)